MPRGDGTGPAGTGPMTGRAAGFCAGYQAPGYANPVGGRGFRGRGRGFWGRGGGQGWRNQYYATGLPGWVRAGYGWPGGGAYPPSYGGQVPMTSTAEEELEMLQQQADGLKQTVRQVEDRIKQLRSETPDK